MQSLSWHEPDTRRTGMSSRERQIHSGQPGTISITGVTVRSGVQCKHYAFDPFRFLIIVRTDPCYVPYEGTLVHGSVCNDSKDAADLA